MEILKNVKSFIIKYKIVFICIGVVVVFNTGLFTGCGNYADIKRQLNEALVNNEELGNSNKRLQENIAGLEQTITSLRADKSNLQDTNNRLGETYERIRSAYIRLQEGVVTSELDNREASRIIKESIKLLEAENNP